YRRDGETLRDLQGSALLGPRAAHDRLRLRARGKPPRGRRPEGPMSDARPAARIEPAKLTWVETGAEIFSGRMLVALLMGFASGLPLLLTGSVLQAWLKDGGIDLKAIGLFALVGLPYTVKFLWSPLFDRYSLPFFGRRRGWLTVMQIALAAALVALSFAHPAPDRLLPISIAALLGSFFSASQDIV